MIRSRVLVTGAGGAAGVAVIRHLAALGMFTVATDTDPLAAGLFLATEHAVVAPVSEPDQLIADLTDTAKRFEVDVAVCTVAEEMLAIAGREHELKTNVWVPTPESIEACLDKLHFADLMVDAHVPVPATAPGACLQSTAWDAVPGPWVVKPRSGRGSRDVYAVDEITELAWACRRVKDPIVQTRVVGREFTVDLLTDRNGALVGAVPRWRVETKAGISTKGMTFADNAVVSIAARALRAVGLCGAANLQGFVGEDGNVSVIEINPRFSGGLSLSLAAGADLVAEYLLLAQGQPPSRERLQFRSGVTMTAPLPRSDPAVKILVACGTRPEIVKLAPVTHTLVRHGHSVRVVFTGQHTDPRLADDFLADLGLRPDEVWDLPSDEAARVGALLTAAYAELAAHLPDAVLLLGDTHTVPLFALAARRFGVPVVHIEAGLRSFNPRSLEESHRRTATALASLHFAPTDLAARFLDAEGVDPRRVIVVGNPVTDTLARRGPPQVPVDERTGVLFTAHRATNVDTDDALAAIRADRHRAGG